MDYCVACEELSVSLLLCSLVIYCVRLSTDLIKEAVQCVWLSATNIYRVGFSSRRIATGPHSF